MASWRTEPARLRGEWFAFRQTTPGWPPLYHEAGEPQPSQSSARWHIQGRNHAQYASLEPAGAWAELVRYEEILQVERARQYTRRLWQLFVRERQIADLSSFDRYRECGLDPRIAVGDHQSSRVLAQELREAGYRGLISPSAALPGATNLTLFGERFEREMLGGLDAWVNPDSDLWIPCALVAEGPPPAEVVERTVLRGDRHAGFERWRRSN